MKAVALLALLTSCEPGWMWEDFRPSTWLNDLKWLGIILVVTVLGGLIKGLAGAIVGLFRKSDR